MWLLALSYQLLRYRHDLYGLSTYLFDIAAYSGLIPIQFNAYRLIYKGSS
jgi:hypothetical protein